MMRVNLLAALAVVVSACGPSISSDRDASVPIPVGSTYSWGERGPRELPGERNPAVNNDIVDSRIRGAIDREMAAKGFRLVGSGGDFLIHYHIGAQPRRDTLVTVNRPVGGQYARPFIRCGAVRCWNDWTWSDWGPPEVFVREVPYYEGALLIDLTLGSTGRLVWRGVGRERVDEPQVSQSDITDIVRQILRKL
jgi:hypothetical protein